MAAAFAQFESRLISDRVKEGMANARRKGKQIGNQSLPDETIARLLDYFHQEAGIRSTARQLNLSPGTVSKYSHRFREE